MQRRLGRLLPIVLIAMLVQILAPIGASWAFGATASDPLHLAGICSSAVSDAAAGGDTTPHQVAATCCTLCCVAQSVTPTPDPQAAFVTLQRDADIVVWRDGLPERLGLAVNSQAQARAPPVLS